MKKETFEYNFQKKTVFFIISQRNSKGLNHGAIKKICFPDTGTGTSFMCAFFKPSVSFIR